MSFPLFRGAVLRLATCVVAVISFVGTSAFAEDVAVEAPPARAPPVSWTGLGNVKSDLFSATASAGNTIPGFSLAARVYPRGLFMGGDQIGYNSHVTGGLAYGGKVDLELGAGLNYRFH
jgi:hypothetical protein